MQDVQQDFDQAAAITYGKLIDIVYALYTQYPGNTTPPVPTLPDDMELVAYVQMRDFFISTGPYEFYGLLVQSSSDPSRFIMAIRGTHGLTEWFDDLASVVPRPWDGPGAVGYGFNRIYSTMKVVPPSPSEPAMPLLADGRPAENFAKQVARTASAARNRRSPSAAAPSAPIEVQVAGHSLGAALATLYVAQNAAPKGDAPGFGYNIVTPVIYTFASPRVGDQTFATAFDALQITSWRIVNDLDLVPKVPIVDFVHVATPRYYNSGWETKWSLECWHNLDTYLHLINASCPLSPSCASSWSAVDRVAIVGRDLLDRRAAPETVPAVTVRAEPSTVETPTVTVTVTVSGFGKG